MKENALKENYRYNIWWVLAKNNNINNLLHIFITLLYRRWNCIHPYLKK